MLSSQELVDQYLVDQDAIYPKKGIGMVSITGPDAKKFLQGQTTCDLNKVTDTTGTYGAVCTNKGRIICNFFLIQQQDRLLLLMSEDLVATSLSHLKKYAVFFKAELEDASNEFTLVEKLSASQAPKPDQLSEQFTVQQQDDIMRLQLADYPLQWEWQLSSSQHEQVENLSHLAGLALLTARPLISQTQSETLLPQWLNMQINGGISFTKGCYTGQEIVARMKYRGKSKKHLALAYWSNTAESEKVIQDDDGKNIGEIFAMTPIGEGFLGQIILNQDPSELHFMYIGNTKIELVELPYQLDLTD
jgi:folate-binding protein YgfZ